MTQTTQVFTIKRMKINKFIKKNLKMKEKITFSYNSSKVIE